MVICIGQVKDASVFLVEFVNEAEHKSRYNHPMAISRVSRRIFCFLFLLSVIAFVVSIHGFLARNAPVEGEILVVESWLWNRPALWEAVEEFRRRDYVRLVLVGQSSYNKNAKNLESDSDLAAERLVDLGIERAFLTTLTTSHVKRRRTFSAAQVFAEWLHRNYPEVRAINVFTIDVHARRSQLSFKKAIGPNVNVGIIAGRQTAYVPWRWWTSITGIKLVMRNLVGYIYEALSGSLPVPPG